MNKIHDNTMAVKVDGSRNGEPTVVQCLHVCKLLGSRYAGQVQPGGAVAMCVVVPFIFDIAETCAAESVKQIFSLT